MYKLVVSCLMFLSFASVDATEYVCSHSVLNVHKEPKELSEVISQLIWAESVDVIEQQYDGWAKIATTDNQEGWVPMACLTAFEDGEEYIKENYVMVTSRVAHVYLIKDYKMYPPFFSLPYGAKLELLAPPENATDPWVQVRLLGGEVAFMQVSDLVLNPPALSLKEMVDLSKSFLGVAYIWGGTSAYGFDNTGFVTMLYRQMGIDLPRDAISMTTATALSETRVSDIQPGALLFFAVNDPNVIDHVGIYIGNGDFIHALSTINKPAKVQVSSIRNTPWQAALKKCAQIAK